MSPVRNSYKNGRLILSDLIYGTALTLVTLTMDSSVIAPLDRGHQVLLILVSTLMTFLAGEEPTYRCFLIQSLIVCLLSSDCCRSTCDFKMPDHPEAGGRRLVDAGRNGKSCCGNDEWN